MLIPALAILFHTEIPNRSFACVLKTANEAESIPTGESPQSGSLAMSKDSASKVPRSTNANSPGATPKAESVGSIATPESVQADSFTPKATGGTAPADIISKGGATVKAAIFHLWHPRACHFYSLWLGQQGMPGNYSPLKSPPVAFLRSRCSTWF